MLLVPAQTDSSHREFRTMRTVIGFFVGAAILWTLTPFAFAQILPMGRSSGYIIYGIIYYPDGTPARGASVRISSAAGLDRQTYADANGRYEFRDIASGRYRVAATNLDGRDLVADSAEVDTSRAASSLIQVSIYFRPRADATKEVADSPAISAKAASQRIPKQALKALEQGQKLGLEGKYAQAEESFTKAIEAYPNYLQGLVERGNIRVARGRVTEATADFARALEIDPHYGPALCGSGICKFSQAKYDDAIVDLEKATAAEPNNAKNYMFLGLAHMALDHREPARFAFQRALNLDPKGSVRAHVHLANLHIKENRPAEAIAELDAYLTAVPNPPDRDKLLALEVQLRAAVKK